VVLSEVLSHIVEESTEHVPDESSLSFVSVGPFRHESGISEPLEVIYFYTEHRGV
jgi:hypothetical protein